VHSNPHGTHPLTLIATLLLFPTSTWLSLCRKWPQFDKAVGGPESEQWRGQSNVQSRTRQASPAIGVALTNSFLYSIKKQSLARLERHESLKSRGARVRFHYWRKFSRADFPRPGRTRLKLCFALNPGPQALLRLIFVRSNAGSQKSRVGWHEILSVTTASRVRRDKAALSSGCKPARQPLQPEATGAVMEVTKWLKPSV
jgi:hypothetical protein